VAFANPRTAPCGAAAQAVLQAWGHLDALQGRLIRGEHLVPAYQLVTTGNAGFGLLLRLALHKWMTSDTAISGPARSSPWNAVNTSL
jgi:molybdate transport system substrate-binding protein